jgi:hypothetical protein
MPQIIIKARMPNGILGAVTLKERVVPTEPQNEHCVAQLIERVGWAVTDAEQLESQTNNSHPDGPTHASPHLTIPPGARTPASLNTGADLGGASPRRLIEAQVSR